MMKFCLCGCLLDAPLERLPDFFNHPEVTLIEWRLDVFIRHHSLETTLSEVRRLNSFNRHPVLVTNRPKREGGVFEGSEELRVEVLQTAAGAGVEWVDLESDISEEALGWFRSHGVKVLLSRHEFSGTPDRSSLQRTAGQMAGRGVDAVKIVTYAHKPEDNLRVLELIAYGRQELGVEVIAFCMGPSGRWSRLACLLLGSPWTYVQLPGQSSAAPGQITAARMRMLLDGLGCSAESCVRGAE